jgi:hypothetical protein
MDRASKQGHQSTIHFPRLILALVSFQLSFQEFSSNFKLDDVRCCNWKLCSWEGGTGYLSTSIQDAEKHIWGLWGLMHTCSVLISFLEWILPWLQGWRKDRYNEVSLGVCLSWLLAEIVKNIGCTSQWWMKWLVPEMYQAEEDESMLFYIRSALKHSILGIRHVSRTKEMAVMQSLSDPFLLNDIRPEHH